MNDGHTQSLTGVVVVSFYIVQVVDSSVLGLQITVKGRNKNTVSFVDGKFELCYYISRTLYRDSNMERVWGFVTKRPRLSRFYDVSNVPGLNQTQGNTQNVLQKFDGSKYQLIRPHSNSVVFVLIFGLYA